MTLRDFMLLLLTCISRDHVARANACRALAVACPLMTFEPGEDGVLLTMKSGSLMKPIKIRVELVD